MGLLGRVVIVVVGFRNAVDIVDCLRALARAQPEPTFEVFIAENGGPAAMDALISVLSGNGSPCRAVSEPELPIESSTILRRRLFRLIRANDKLGSRVHVAEMTENLGYARAINAWLRPLLKIPGWEGAWILNPDTEPTPSALAELVAYSARRGRGMVGSCMTPTAHPDRVHSRGLAWRKLVAKTLAVDYYAPITPAPDPDDVEARLDAPSGASCYITRDLIEKIGLMDERYFLYFEDLEWGCRAKRVGRIGYAHRSVVPHKGGTAIGSSPISSYLEIRNRIHFVRDKYPAWLPWTILVQIAHAAAYGAVGKPKNMMVAFQGLVAGIMGEVGRPDWILNADRSSPAVQRYMKIAVSGLYFVALRSIRRLREALGRNMPRSMTVLYYHSVPWHKRSGFMRHMEILAQHAQVVPADWHGKTDPVRPTVAITFDDGFTSVIDNALPELAKHDLPCTIFVPSGVLGRSPDWAMEGSTDRTEVVIDAARLGDLSGPLVTIGAHSVSHPYLTCVAPERARAEITGSRDAIASVIGRSVTLFAFPYGDYDASVVDICRQEGFKHVFTNVPEPFEPCSGSLVRGRVSVDPDDGDFELFLKMSGAYAWMPLCSALKRRLRSVFDRAA
jgi:N-acetylglucosaminyl-diphospho-decaprenol L-rhamnosyltransferase